MKLATLLPLVLAASSSVAASRNRDYNVVQARQAKIQRDVLDVCAALVDVPLAVSVAPSAPPVVIGLINVCLCLSGIPAFIQDNIVAQAAAAVSNIPAVTAELQNLINSRTGKQSCTLPAHAQSICTFAWPCGFECQDGYEPFTLSGTPNPTTCYCPPPSLECNGQCGSFPQGCGSAVPVAPIKRYTKRTEPKCATGKSVCGVEGGKGWECVDTTKDKESCGGCMVPSPFGDSFVEGDDCTTIAHVATGGADCRSGSCYVHSCIDGFAPSAAHDFCVAVLQSKRTILAGGGFKQAGADLKHVVKLGEGAGLRIDVTGL